MLRLITALFLAGFLFLTVTVTVTLLYYVPSLPSTDSLREIRLQVPLRVYSQERELIAEFGEKRRMPVKFSEVPPALVDAVLAAEDDRFYEHPGVDWQGLVRAAYQLARTGEITQGGSTITMQLARNFFLDKKRDFSRKIKEILLSLKIERELTKDEILELYLNKIYLGARTYGVAAAAQVYYGTDLKSLTLPQIAMIAGLPQAPSTVNPVANPEGALKRRAYVLSRMLQLGHIDRVVYEQALAAPETAQMHRPQAQLDAPYIAEMVRGEMVQRYGEDAYTWGYHVITTVSRRLQEGANEALRSHLTRFDHRHGYHGPEKRVPLAKNATESDWQEALQGLNPIAGMRPAVVTKVDRKAVVAYVMQAGQVILQGEDLSWGGHNRPVHVGDVIRLQPRPEGGWRLAQVPKVEGALVSLDPGTGAIQALVGGFDFEQSKFNRATQAHRQPGSSFKPFVYSAALDAGYTPSSIVLDAPIQFHVPGLVGGVWRPENASGKSYGPTRLRDALAFSRNVVSVRLLDDIGVERGVKYFKRFGFAPEQMKPNLSLSLGTAELTPLEMATGYAVFANGGYLVKPYVIDQIEDYNGQVVLKIEPPKLCADCDQGRPLDLDEDADDSNFSLDSQSAPRVIDPQNAYQVSSMMRDVIRIGTGKPAQVLRRKDLSGKTGTTNDVKDVWFAGFNTRVVTAVWMGTDKNDSLGNSESGGSLALPIWIDYMRVALKDVPQSMMKQPSGMVSVRVDKSSGRLASVGSRNAVMETFRAEDMEKLNAEGIQAQPRISTRSRAPGVAAEPGSGIPDQLF